MNIFDACYQDNIHECQRLLNADANLVHSREGGRNHTPLSIASIKGSVQFCALLLTHGADVNSRDSLQCTPLHYACLNGRYNVVDLLIANGANIHALEHMSLTPLYFAVSGLGRPDIARLLITLGANVESRSVQQETPMIQAKSIDMYELLLGAGANINAVSDDGTTALHWAILHEREQECQWLLSHGLGPDAVCVRFRTTALHWLVHSSHRSVTIARLLLEYGADVNACDMLGQTPLRYVPDCSQDLRDLLLAHGANIK